MYHYFIKNSIELLILQATILDILKTNFTQIYLIKIIVISILKDGLSFNRVNFHYNQFYNLLKLIKI